MNYNKKYMHALEIAVGPIYSTAKAILQQEMGFSYC